MGRRSKQPAKKQQPITLHALPLLKKPLEQIGKQINVPGSYWEGRMSADERSTLYKCSMRDFTQMHKFPGEQAPRAAFQLQEMGVAGTGSTEQGDSSGELIRTWTRSTSACSSWWASTRRSSSPPSKQ